MRTGPDKPKTVTCDGCGISIERYASARNPRHYCSELCRHWMQHGAWASPLKIRVQPRAAKTPIPKPKTELICQWCGQSFMSHQSNARYCSAHCTRKYHKAKRRAAEHNAPGTYTWSDVTRLWRLFDKTCAYCRTPTTLADIQPEHVIPISRGGANNIGNLLPSCPQCNRDKSVHSLNRWADSRARRGLPHVHTTWSPTDPRYSHLTLYQVNELHVA